MISKVYLWTNGQVMVFDEEGKQMPGYQGKYANVKDKILTEATEHTKFTLCAWDESMRKQLTKEEFEKGV